MVRLMFMALVIYSSTLKLHVGEYAPPPGKAVRGDILYLHGFADAFQNHLPLFREWTRAGFRVIAFDFPGHGKTQGEGPLASIDAFSVNDLIEIAAVVEEKTRVDRDRPLLLAGWSAGGLVAVRMVQKENLKRFGRRPSGLLLFAPGVPVRSFVGRPSLRYPLGEVTLETLTHNPETETLLPIKPRSPGDVPRFALSLLTASYAAKKERLPVWLPALTFVAGDEEDRYVSSVSLKEWVKKGGGRTIGIQCPHARHWLDNELPEYGGREVLELARDFAYSTIRINGGTRDRAAGVCRRFH